MKSEYISFWEKIIKPEKFSPIKYINWDNPVSSIIKLYPIQYGQLLFRSISNSISDTIIPYLIIIYAVENTQFAFLSVGVLLIYTRLLNWFLGRYSMHLHDLTRRSIYISFNREILTRDPVYFTTHSSGETISIAQRGREGVVYILTSFSNPQSNTLFHQ